MFKPYYKPYIYNYIYIVVYSSVHIPNHPQPVTKPRFHLAMAFAASLTCCASSGRSVSGTGLKKLRGNTCFFKPSIKSTLW